MERDHLVSILRQSPSPAYVVDLGKLEENLRILADVQTQSGASILLALKGFAMFGVAPIVRKYLNGTCASGPHEARLGAEEFGGEVHTFSTAFKQEELIDSLKYSDHIIFNSFGQWKRYHKIIADYGKQVSVGLRVNPEVSTGTVPIYDPCAPGSRLGILCEEFTGESLDGIEGLHFHTLCEQGSDDLEKTLAGFEEHFAEFLPGMKWVNFGGGHHITKPDYDRDLLIRLIQYFMETYELDVYLEPGEAVALNAGILVTEVVDILQRQPALAILDTSVNAHMPDVLEMPYRPDIINGAGPGEKAHTYRLGGMTCLAGDIIGDWSFDKPLRIGDRLAFTDMAHYTMVKNTTFNGVKLPAIATFEPATNKLQLVREFGYADYRNRLS